MRRVWIFGWLILCLIVGTSSWGKAEAAARYGLWEGVGRKAADEAWRMMGGKPSDLLVLTNAGYAVVGGETTEACLDGIQAATGCSAGKGNLLEVHSARDKNLWFFFYDKATGNSAYMEVQGNQSGMNRVEFSRKASANIGMKKILAEPAEWNAKVQQKIFGGNEFGIVTLANVAAKGVPYDFLKAALYHDHLCPGVNSGYLIANYLRKEFPLRSETEKYFIIAAPNWCKDDALQTLLNTTPGKSGMAVIPVNDKVKEKLLPECKNLAGIYIRWDEKSKTGDGMVLSFDFGKGAAMSGVDMSKGFPWESRLKLDIWYLDYYDKPETFVGVIKTFSLAGGERPEDYVLAGTNPLEKLELLKP